MFIKANRLVYTGHIAGPNPGDRKRETFDVEDITLQLSKIVRLEKPGKRFQAAIVAPDSGYHQAKDLTDKVDVWAENETNGVDVYTLLVNRADFEKVVGVIDMTGD